MDQEVFRVRTHDPDGRIVDNAFSYTDVARHLNLPQIPRSGAEVARGVRIVRHEYGPDFVALPGFHAEGKSVAIAWAETLQRTTGPDVGVSLSIPGPVAEEEETPNVRFRFPPGGAEAIAGLIAAEELVWIGPPEETTGDEENDSRRFSLEALAREEALHVESGPTKVRISLPWGNWTRVVHVPWAGEAMIELPTAIGTPPLRVALHKEADRRETSIFGVEGTAPSGRVRGGLAPSLKTIILVPADAGTARWVLQPQSVFQEVPLGCALATLASGEGPEISFPLPEGRGVAIDRSGGGVRVEPISGTFLPAWDKLVAGGRLDPMDPKETGELIAHQKSDWLLGVAAAYTVYASPAKFQRPFFKRVLKELKELADSRRKKGCSAPDLDLLRIALAARLHHLRGSQPLQEPEKGWFLRLDATESLVVWAEARSVPMFRWGVSLAVHLLAWAGSEEPFASWREELTRILPLLSPISVWTAWTEKDTQPSKAGS